MRLQSKKLIAVLCALAMIISVFPVQADAAAKPKFVKNYTVLYENSTGKGVYNSLQISVLLPHLPVLEIQK